MVRFLSAFVHVVVGDILHSFVDSFICVSCRCLAVYPKGNNVHYLSLYLEVANVGSLPSGWRRHAKFAFTILNKLPEKIFKLGGDYFWMELYCLRVFVFKSTD